METLWGHPWSLQAGWAYRVWMYHLDLNQTSKNQSHPTMSVQSFIRVCPRRVEAESVSVPDVSALCRRLLVFAARMNDVSTTDRPDMIAAVQELTRVALVMTGRSWASAFVGPLPHLNLLAATSTLWFYASSGADHEVSSLQAMEACIDELFGGLRASAKNATGAHLVSI